MAERAHGTPPTIEIDYKSKLQRDIRRMLALNVLVLAGAGTCFYFAQQGFDETKKPVSFSAEMAGNTLGMFAFFGLWLKGSGTIWEDIQNDRIGLKNQQESQKRFRELTKPNSVTTIFSSDSDLGVTGRVIFYNGAVKYFPN